MSTTGGGTVWLVVWKGWLPGSGFTVDADTVDLSPHVPKPYESEVHAHVDTASHSVWVKMEKHEGCAVGALVVGSVDTNGVGLDVCHDTMMK